MTKIIYFWHSECNIATTFKRSAGSQFNGSGELTQSIERLEPDWTRCSITSPIISRTSRTTEDESARKHSSPLL